MAFNQATTFRVGVAMIAPVAAFASVTSTALADIIHVPGDYPTIQQGIDAAVDGDEVVLADGTYTGAENRNIDFLGKLITVRSENGPENCIVDVQEVSGSRGFLFVNGETSAAVLEGITVRRGRLTWPNWPEGGASVLILDSSPTLINCVFSDNEVYVDGLDGSGGAIYSNGAPLLIGCVFDGNSAGGCYGYGGGFSNKGGTATFIDCSFTGNHTVSGCAGCGWGLGGGLYSSNSGRVTAIGCDFSGNHVTGPLESLGGGVYMPSGAGLFANCVFAQNSNSFGVGGGAYLAGSVTIFNSLFVGNDAERGGGSRGGNLINCTFTENEATVTGGAVDGGTLTNCIVWNNSNSQVVGGATVTYSHVENGYAGEGNISGDPRFDDPDSGDYRLKAVSPCIDAGDNTIAGCLLSDLDGNERLFDHPGTRDTGLGRAPIVDMGAYEFGSRPAAAGEDCNLNWLDDACETANGYTPDCNRNGVPDACDIADGASQDADNNGVPDECEDCNGNDVPDGTDIADGTSQDCNANGIPDECDIADGVSEDCNANGVPDECEADCNFNGVHDDCEGWSVAFTHPAGLPKNVPANREFAIEVVIETTGDAEIDPQSATIHVSSDGGAFVSTPMDEVGELTFLATLPASVCATQLEYYFSVDAVDGCVIIDPLLAPQDVYVAYAGTAVTTFLDEFEGDVSGWTIINDKSLTSGAWEQAEPNGTIYFGEPSAPDEDATAGDVAVMAFVTENGPRGGDATDNDVDGGPTQLISPALDLTDTVATISYARWFFSTAGEHDVLLVEISDDDGANWVLVHTVTGTGGQWQTVSFDVNDFIEPTSTVRVRFTAADSPNDSVTEAGIDDFMVFYTSCVDDCPWDLDGDGVVGTTDLIVLLGSWGDPYGTADLIELLGAWGECP